MDKRIKEFIEQLATEPDIPNTFNPYNYKLDSNEIRRKNLYCYFNEMQNIKPKILIVGEAPGYRGCRLTGVPFTSEFIIRNGVTGLSLFGEGKGYQLESSEMKPTKENTATIFWEIAEKYKFLPLVWNAFPFHPYKCDDEKSNRAPNKEELCLGRKYINTIVEIFQVEKIVAVGNKAEKVLLNCNITAEKIRHPSNGGKLLFEKGIKSISG